MARVAARDGVDEVVARVAARDRGAAQSLSMRWKGPLAWHSVPRSVRGGKRVAARRVMTHRVLQPNRIGQL